MNILCPRPESTKSYLSLPKIKLLLLVLFLSSCNVFKMMGKKSEIATTPTEPHGYFVHQIFDGTDYYVKIYNTKSGAMVTPTVSSVRLTDVLDSFIFKNKIYIVASILGASNTQIYRYDPSTNTTVHAISLNAGSPGAMPGAFTMDDNYLYFLDGASSQPTLYRYSGSGSATAIATTATSVAADFSPRGYLYNGKIYFCDSSSSAEFIFANLSSPYEIALYAVQDARGCDPYATYFHNGRAYTETVDGIESRSFSNIGSATAELAGFFNTQPFFGSNPPKGKIILIGDSDNDTLDELWLFDTSSRTIENLYPNGVVDFPIVITAFGSYYFSIGDGTYASVYRTDSKSDTSDPIYFEENSSIYNLFAAGENIYVLSDTGFHKIDKENRSIFITSSIDSLSYSSFLVFN